MASDTKFDEFSKIYDLCKNYVGWRYRCFAFKFLLPSFLLMEFFILGMIYKSDFERNYFDEDFFIVRAIYLIGFIIIFPVSIYAVSRKIKYVKKMFNFS